MVELEISSPSASPGSPREEIGMSQIYRVSRLFFIALPSLNTIWLYQINTFCRGASRMKDCVGHGSVATDCIFLPFLVGSGKNTASCDFRRTTVIVDCGCA